MDFIWFQIKKKIESLICNVNDSQKEFFRTMVCPKEGLFVMNDTFSLCYKEIKTNLVYAIFVNNFNYFCNKIICDELILIYIYITYVKIIL